MSYLLAVRAIFVKEVTAERRSGETVATALVFALIAATLFKFALDPGAGVLPQVLPGMLWLMIYFAGLLGTYRSIYAEVRGETLAGLLLAPVDPSAIYYGKLLANLAFLALTEAAAVPFFFIFFGYRPGGSLWLLAAVLALGTLAFAAAATFVAAVAVGTRAGEVLLPVLLFPLLVPAALGAVEATRAVLEPGAAELGLWLKLLGAYDAIFLVLPWLLFEHLVEV